jgi:hypothetical protein
MPQLPSGLNLALSRDGLFDHGGNWFACPDGHFWYWAAAPEMGEPPFAADITVMRAAEHAPVPTDREQVAHFIYVLEMGADGQYTWRGEWLASFPRYIRLDDRDLTAWRAWLARREVDEFLDETIVRCAQLAEISRHAIGYAVLQDVEQPADDQGWARAALNPTTRFPK